MYNSITGFITSMHLYQNSITWVIWIDEQYMHEDTRQIALIVIILYLQTYKLIQPLPPTLLR